MFVVSVLMVSEKAAVGQDFGNVNQIHRLLRFVGLAPRKNLFTFPSTWTLPFPPSASFLVYFETCSRSGRHVLHRKMFLLLLFGFRKMDQRSRLSDIERRAFTSNAGGYWSCIVRRRKAAHWWVEPMLRSVPRSRTVRCAKRAGQKKRDCEKFGSIVVELPRCFALN